MREPEDVRLDESLDTAEELLEQAYVARERGDYREARQLALKAAKSGGESEVGGKAAFLAASFGVDRTAIAVGGLALVLYALAWIFALAQ